MSPRETAMATAIQRAVEFFEVGLREVTFTEQVQALRDLIFDLTECLEQIDGVPE